MQSRYLIEWRGDRTPQGAVVGPYTVGWCRDEILTDITGDHIGSYRRIVDGAGPDRDLQVMLVFVDRRDGEETVSSQE